MGRASRRKPERLAEKLLHIRTALGLSQNELIRQLRLEVELFQDSISAFERDVREPDLLVLLQYARVAGVYIDALVDDSIDLPKKLPATTNYRWALPHNRCS
jgi:transcriptional regulator with XRE-family HTH domain